MPSNSPLRARGISRRSLLRRTAASGLVWLLMPGCGVPYAPEQGPAYAPWRFPAGERRPEWLAVGAAILAASPHNTQPWRFAVAPDRIELYADFERNLGAMDGLRRELHIGLGCALANLVIALRANGMEPTVTLFPDGSADYVARVDFAPTAAPSPLAERLYPAIVERHTHRGRYVNGGLPPSVAPHLAALITDDRIRLTALLDAGARRRFRRETIAATEAIVADVEMNEAGHRWFRTSKADIERHRDGPTLDASGNGAAIRFFGKLAGETDAATAGSYWIGLTEGDHTTAGGFMILSSDDRDDRVQQIEVGRSWQRIHLQGTLDGLSMQPLNQIAERADREQALGLEPRFTEVMDDLAGHAGGQMLFRVGYAWDPAFASPRRPLEWVAEEVV